MKRIKEFSLFLFALALGTTSCVNAQFSGEKGNGNVVKQDREIGHFTAISAGTGLDVFVVQGETEAVTVEADENLQDNIITEVRGGKLIVKVEDRIRKAKAKSVYITLVNVNKINISSGCDFETKSTLNVKELDIEVSSGADAKLDIHADKLSCSVSSGADADLWGTANYFYAKASSGSDLDAHKLTAKTCKAKASSGADVSVNATEEIDASASSGGNVSYYGNPTKVDVNTSSGGDVNRR
ncbi:head GIN domain-containing protein [Ancylomarina sp. 16SWW S1-10-2]|uniref:head GIN domain-containing protein n=1 Tax=Ancylomarina sp. 16SWW S1-10-2 TaxID=2499681 RepID=UPI0012ADFA3B|nr:head GIN domain-containing protein [Ancylomarina sp. 16SWW S1-10-2]MRT93169.1 DUF2807 domain-containing protein [Ancylomarina sp. 16SWW S1-10-2]